MSRPRDRFLFGQTPDDEDEPDLGDDVDPDDVYGDYVEPSDGTQDDDAAPDDEED